MKIYATDYQGKIYKDKPKHLFFGGAFLHGKLEKMNGYDLFGISREDMEYLERLDSGIQYVTVVMRDGANIKAKFFFWTVWNGKQLKGLVVLPDDIKGNKYALKMLETKPDII